MHNDKKILESFLEEWPIERLERMTLEEYTNLDKTSFCYWLESKTNDLGSIWGGSSYKFGIYKRKGDRVDRRSNYSSDDTYAWANKYGDTKEKAFASIRQLIVDVALSASRKQFDKIDAIDLGVAYKWKIAFLYSNESLLPIYKKEGLVYVSKQMGVKNKRSVGQMQVQLVNMKPGSESIYSFANTLWDSYMQSLNEGGVNSSNKKFWLYSPGEKGRSWDEFYRDGLMGLGWDNLEDLRRYADKNEINEALQSFDDTDAQKMNDASANYDFAQTINVGDVVFVKTGQKAIVGYGMVTSDYFYDNSREEYHHLRKVDWKAKGEWTTDFNLAQKTLTMMSDKAKVEYLESLFKSTKEKVSERIPLNQILYGPPGTGKTYELSAHYFDEFTSRKASVSKEEYIKSMIEDKAWWEVLALVLLDLGSSGVNDIYNHSLLQLKASLSSSNTVRQTVWGQLQVHTVDACENVKISKKGTPLIFNKTDDKEWEVLEDEIKEQVPELIELHQKIKRFSPRSDIEIKRYEFVTFHQSFAYEDFVEGIKPDLTSDDGDLNYTIEDGVFKKMCSKARNDSDNNYAIFIDEINRGNVSQIFGELITLIEADKREGQDNELSVILPYSKAKFSVPNNLHIIGTMNTADRSVEALDTALRRRFQFVEMAPKPDIIEKVNKKREVSGVDLVELLETINQRIEILLDRDHLIGHSYFLHIDTLEDLKVSFSKQIIPLLQEYFYGDYGKIALVLGEGYCRGKRIENSSKVFAKVEGYETDSFDDQVIFELVDVLSMSDEDFVKALETLLPSKGE